MENLTKSASTLLGNLASKLSVTKILVFSLILNLAAFSALYYLWKHKPVPPPNDAAQLIQENQKVLDKMKDQLISLQEQHQKNFDEYNRQINIITEDYNTRISQLEDAKKVATQKIIDTHRGDVDGLAKDFSGTMNIKLGGVAK